LILTHDHVDHVYGFPHLIQALAIEGRADEIDLLAPGQALATVDGMLRVHNLAGDRYPEVRHIEIRLGEAIEVLRVEGLTITASATEHTRDTVALRFETETAKVCYSSDTRPCAAVTRLAAGADILLHDCAGPHRLRDAFSASHSSALEAARVAAAAGVRKLVLMHLGARDEDILKECQAEAEAELGRAVDLALDGMRWVVSNDAGDTG
jgi:ribonuclease Z